ncbi:TPA: hypothetical protein ACIYMC_004831 [Escherichia coli]|uniref:hypothetical protein n=1 Tax=Escherichia coli TaxID=562 RepID=UPI000A4B850D|nr:hypothetical protein [Escherichia coli]MCO4970515.1 hypothetical protein [Escherichia coli]MCS1120571.1 hypothetical protein [Escherichia coli]MDE7994420.1 hypothetical protein [Escherichia coli]
MALLLSSSKWEACYLDLDNDRPVWHQGFHPELEFADEADLLMRKSIDHYLYQ